MTGQAQNLYIGVMSGTSCDGIDAVAAYLQDQPTMIASYHQPFSTELRQQIETLIEASEISLPLLLNTEHALSCAYSEAINTLKHQLDARSAASICAVGCHGQTIYHAPNATPAVTCQLLNPSLIANQTGLTTVADFRRKDVANGGQGAPFVPIFHQHVFGSTQEARVILNIGGIANISILPPDGQLTGYDTGPGNRLIDAWMTQHWHQPYDEQGALARTGKVIPSFLALLLSDSYFSAPPPKSTGREYFNLDWVRSYLNKIDPISPIDILSTLTELTAQTIAATLSTVNASGTVYLCGGGSANLYLRERITALSGWQTTLTESLGLDASWIEAMAFAWLAKQTLEKKPLNISSVTGAHSPAILGGVYYP